MTNDTPSFPSQNIVRLLDPDAIALADRPLTGGVSAQIRAIEYRAGDGTVHEVVVRQHGNAEWKNHDADVTTTEFNLQTKLFGSGLPVPEPLLLDVSGAVLPSPYLVMSMVRGVTAVPEEERDHAVAQMADFLVRLHRTERETIELPDSEDPVEGALTYVPDNAAHAELRAAIARWQTRPVQPALLHGDFWPGNILWHGGRIAAVIDWEDATIGPVESDLAGCRSELMVMYGEDAMTRFTERYLRGTDREIADLPVWEVYASFAALATMSEWGLPADVEAHRRERTEIFAERAVRELMKRAGESPHARET